MSAGTRPVRSTAYLLDLLVAFITRFAAVSADEAALLATWVLHTHTLAAAELTPYVLVTSATKGCGKSTLLSVLRALVLRPIVAASITPAAVYRVIEIGNEPTMLLDEQDPRRAANEELRRVVNAGYTRGTMVMRVVSGVVEWFPVFCPKALAGIGQFDPTIADRSFHVNMQKKRSTDPIERFRPTVEGTQKEIDAVTSEIADWAASTTATLAVAEPMFPDEFDGRECDVFEPLFAIADDAGREWGAKVRAAAVRNRHAAKHARLDAGTELLRDLRDIWGDETTGFVPTHRVLGDLLGDGELRWATYSPSRGALTEHALGRLVRRFGISSVRDTDRDQGSQFRGRTVRGYRREDFQEAMERHLDEVPSGGAQTNDLPPVNPFLAARTDVTIEVVESTDEPKVETADGDNDADESTLKGNATSDGGADVEIDKAMPVEAADGVSGSVESGRRTRRRAAAPRDVPGGDAV